MKRKKWMALVMLLVLVVCVACDDSRASEITEAEGMVLGYGQRDEVEASVDCELTIYYGDGQADGLLVEVVQAEELTAENLLDALARRNIVSIDTKVQSLECVEEKGKTHLKLDLSEAFGQYLNTMGENSEKVVMAALVNTFLYNYQAEELQLTVEGQVLETIYASYGEGLTWQNIGF